MVVEGGGAVKHAVSVGAFEVAKDTLDRGEMGGSWPCCVTSCNVDWVADVETGGQGCVEGAANA